MIGKLLTTTLLAIFPFITLSANIFDNDNHEFNVGFRPRIATVKSDVDADAASLLMRASVESHWNERITSVLELDYVHLWWEDKFSNGVNFNGTPVIPDVSGLDLNQLAIQFKATNTLSISLGREAVNLGNQRLVGTNNFWQNEQTFDGASLTYELGSASSISYRYVSNANRINGEQADATLSPNDSNFTQNNGIRPAKFLGDHSHDTHLFWAEYREFDHSIIQGYYFDIDIEEAPGLSNRTLGARIEIKRRLNKKRVFAHAELALQQRPNVHTSQYTRYYNIGAGIGYLTHELAVNFEQLGENNGMSFVTPLASLHETNGWADKFLITPSTGLDDYSLRYIWRLSPWKFNLRYHLFNRDDTSSTIGKELDIDISYKLAHKNIVLLRFADFNSQTDNFTSEQRLFLQYIYNL